MGQGHDDFQNRSFPFRKLDAAEFQPMLLAFPNPLPATVLGSVSASLECDRSFLTGNSGREQSEGNNHV